MARPSQVSAEVSNAWPFVPQIGDGIAQGGGIPVRELFRQCRCQGLEPRRKVTRILSDPAASVLVVEHRDRLTRFGSEHLAASGRRIGGAR